MQFYSKDKTEVLKELNSSINGLSEEEAIKRLNENGKNCLEAEKPKSLFKRFLEQLMDPMIIVLIVAALISGVLAFIENDSYADVIIIMIVVVVNAILGVYQENKAEKAIEALQKMSAPTSKVIRNNKLCIVNSEDIVVGDIISLEAGDSIPADARVLESSSLQVEEAALTGESIPVDKLIDTIYLREQEHDIILGERKNMVYMGSTVVYGRGLAVVTATGMSTEMGAIATALKETKEGRTPLQIKLDQLSKTLTWLVLIICVVIFGVQLLRANSFNADVALSSFMIAVSLAVAAIPEGLVAVVTVVLSIGVTNMSKRNAIIRKLTAVETLGCAQVICSDKTGTLTQNKMTVVEYFGDSDKELAQAMALCSDAELDESGNIVGEPTEAALVSWANKLKLNKNELKEQMKRIGEAPFDSNRKMMSTVHQDEDGIIQFTKGATDLVIKKCAYYLKDNEVLSMTDEIRQNILSENKKMADKALRVLACAKRVWNGIPDNYNADVLEEDLCFIGLCGMIDPVRPEVKEAISECLIAGIKPIMITGDHVDTAVAIAKELGLLKDSSRAVTGAELNEMSDAEFKKIFKDITVYARVAPEHKTRIVKAWQEEGFITAMTGDGVNDAPSIKSADIGVGMGITGTDVTKNVSDMVLADDNFVTIVGAVEEGRRIYDNIRKVIQFLLGSNMSEVLSIFIATLMGFTVLEPVHLLWINLITDCFPALALGLEHKENGIMNRQPRAANSGIFSEGMGIDIFYQGFLVTVLTITAYFIGQYIEFGTLSFTNSSHGITMAFLTMSISELFHSLNMRSQRQSIFKLKNSNKVLLLSILFSLIATTLVCEVPFLAKAFNFTSVGLKEYLIATGLGVIVIPVVELVKFVQRKNDIKRK